MNKLPYYSALAVLFSALAVSTARAASIEVAAGGNFQEALNAARPGDTIVLQAGATYTGNFRLPTSQRVRPADAVHMARIVSPNPNAAIEADAGAHHYRLIGLELTVQPGNYTFGVLGLGSTDARSVDQLPDNIEVDRLYIHGTPGEGGKRGIFLNTHTAVVRNSHISGFRSDVQDAQAILACAAPGPLLITNNYLEATGENVMFGGCEVYIPRLVPTDVTFTRNHLFKPLSWQGQQRLVVKNSFEIKGGRRIRIDSNIFENNWTAGQSGFMILFTVRAEGRDENNQPYGLVEDIAFTNNLLLNSTHGISILGRDDARNKVGVAQRIVIRNNVFEKVPGRLFLLLEGPSDVVIDHNTSTAGDMTLLVTHSVTGFEMTNNVLSLGTYGVFGDGRDSGMNAVRAYLPGSKIEGNLFIGQPTAEYPANNLFVSTVSSVGFTDATAGNYRLTTASPYRGKARDGQDPGINAEAFSQSQRGVLNGSVRALLNSNAIVNTASFEQKLSPGARVSIFGENLSDCLTAAYPPVRSLCQTEVLINSNAALLYYLSSTQIVAQLPAAGLPPGEAFEVIVRRAGDDSSDPVIVPAEAVKVVSPAMYFYRLAGDTANRVMMMQADGTFNGPGVGLGPGTFRPVRPGEEVTVFINGAGPTDPFLEEGAVAPWDPPAAFANRVTVYINDIEQRVTFAGAIPELVGLYSLRFQVNREMPAASAGGDWIWINVLDTDSPRLMINLANTGS